MKDSKSVKFLAVFETAELKEMGNYLKRLYAPKKSVLKLFNLVKKYHPDFNSKRLEKEKAFSLLFPGEVYNYQKLMDASSELFRLSKEFILWYRMKNDSLEKDMIMLRIYQERNLKKLFLQQISKTQAFVEPKEGLWSYLQRMQLNHLLYFSANSKEIFSCRPYLDAANEELDKFYSISKLMYHGQIITREKILGEPFLDILSDSPKTKITSYIQDKNLVITIHALTSQLLEKPSDEIYDQLKPLFFENRNQLFKDEKQSVLNGMLNFAIGKIRADPDKYLSEGFELYKFGFEEKIILEDGLIGATNFSNIVNIGCRNKNFSWVEYFIEEAKQYLEPSLREDIYKLGAANLKFAEKKYDQTILILRGIQFKTIFHAISSKILLLKAYFEYYDKDFTLTNCNSFEQFLRRKKNKLGNKSFMGAKNFVSYVRKILESKRDKSDLLKEFNNLALCDGKEWIKTKLEEMKK